jgi:hypothetical protein
MRQSSLEDVCDAIGYRATRVIAAWFAGRRFYVPQHARQDHPLVQLLGLESFRELVGSYGGDYVEVPTSNDDQLFQRNREIAEQLVFGLTAGEIAERHGLSRRRVEQIRQDLVANRWLEYAQRRSPAAATGAPVEGDDSIAAAPAPARQGRPPRAVQHRDFFRTGEASD